MIFPVKRILELRGGEARVPECPQSVGARICVQAVCGAEAKEKGPFGPCGLFE